MIDYIWIVAAGALLIGSLTGILIFAMISSGKTEDLYKENEKLKQNGQLLKNEIIELNKKHKQLQSRREEETQI